MSSRCPRCGGPLVEIVLDNESGRLTMRSCTACDAREWHNEGEPIELQEVLDELTDTGSRRRYRRQR